MQGFLGTRSDFIVDAVMVYFALLPFLMLYSFHLVSKQKVLLHRNLQIFLLLLTTISVISLELDIRLGELNAKAYLSSYYDSLTLKYTFFVHLLFAISSFLLWAWMVFKYSNFSLNKIKSTKHILLGKIVFWGMVLTVITGWLIYMMVFAL